ncbi:hypothetical protein [Novosphingopyxis sp.]|uniref:hypothetical protein n=1 Tax=Novosphingopyxis sp. TaxID=2709690 RepID=UPI003B5A3EF9
MQAEQISDFGSKIMTGWHCKDGRESASTTVLSMLDAIENSLSAEHRLRPRVLSILLHDEESLCEVELELIPDVVLLVQFGFDWDDEYLEFDEYVEPLGVDSVAYLVSYWARYEANMRLQETADRMVTTRRRLEIISERLTAQGTPMEFVDLRILRTRTFSINKQLPVITRYRTLDHHLEMEIFETESGSLSQALEEYCVVGYLKYRAALRDKFSALGAHGYIDRLAVNSIELNHNLSDFIKSGGIRKSSGQSGLPIENGDGHVRFLGWKQSSGLFLCNRNTIIIKNRSLPETILNLLPGRPITDLVEHPVLTPDLIITCAWVENRNGSPNLKIEFDQPRFLFCRNTGRIWREGN